MPIHSTGLEPGRRSTDRIRFWVAVQEVNLIAIISALRDCDCDNRSVIGRTMQADIYIYRMKWKLFMRPSSAQRPANSEFQDIPPASKAIADGVKHPCFKFELSRDRQPVQSPTTPSWPSTRRSNWTTCTFCIHNLSIFFLLSISPSSVYFLSSLLLSIFFLLTIFLCLSCPRISSSFLPLGSGSLNFV